MKVWYRDRLLVSPSVLPLDIQLPLKVLSTRKVSIVSDLGFCVCGVAYSVASLTTSLVNVTSKHVGGDTFEITCASEQLVFVNVLLVRPYAFEPSDRPMLRNVLPLIFSVFVKVSKKKKKNCTLASHTLPKDL